MPDQPVRPPALSDANLFETLDLLSTVVASVSDRVDSQTEAIGKLSATVAETRQAAFAARSQTDPKMYAELAGEQMTKSFKVHTEILTELVTIFADEMKTLVVQKTELNAIRQSLQASISQKTSQAERWMARAPFIACFGLLLALGLSLALPRLFAATTSGCPLLGGEWLKSTSADRMACVFYKQ